MASTILFLQSQTKNSQVNSLYIYSIFVLCIGDAPLKMHYVTSHKPGLQLQQPLDSIPQHQLLLEVPSDALDGTDQEWGIGGATN